MNFFTLRFYTFFRLNNEKRLNSNENSLFVLLQQNSILLQLSAN